MAINDHEKYIFISVYMCVYLYGFTNGKLHTPSIEVHPFKKKNFK